MPMNPAQTSVLSTVERETDHLPRFVKDRIQHSESAYAPTNIPSLSYGPGFPEVPIHQISHPDTNRQTYPDPVDNLLPLDATAVVTVQLKEAIGLPVGLAARGNFALFANTSITGSAIEQPLMRKTPAMNPFTSGFQPGCGVTWGEVYEMKVPVHAVADATFSLAIHTVVTITETGETVEEVLGAIDPVPLMDVGQYGGTLDVWLALSGGKIDTMEGRQPGEIIPQAHVVLMVRDQPSHIAERSRHARVPFKPQPRPEKRVWPELEGKTREDARRIIAIDRPDCDIKEIRWTLGLDMMLGADIAEPYPIEPHARELEQRESDVFNGNRNSLLPAGFLGGIFDPPRPQSARFSAASLPPAVAAAQAQRRATGTHINDGVPSTVLLFFDDKGKVKGVPRTRFARYN